MSDQANAKPGEPTVNDGLFKVGDKVRVKNCPGDFTVTRITGGRFPIGLNNGEFVSAFDLEMIKTAEPAPTTINSDHPQAKDLVFASVGVQDKRTIPEPTADVGAEMAEGMVTKYRIGVDYFCIRYGQQPLDRLVLSMRSTNRDLAVDLVRSIIAAVINSARKPLVEELAQVLRERDELKDRLSDAAKELKNEIATAVAEVWAECVKITDVRKELAINEKKTLDPSTSEFHYWQGVAQDASNIACLIRSRSAQPTNPPTPKAVVDSPTVPTMWLNHDKRVAEEERKRIAKALRKQADTPHIGAVTAEARLFVADLIESDNV
jgi:hypothetical protein